MYKIKTEAAFAAAHSLPNHPGKCKNLHGHRWRVVVEVEVEEHDKNTGMVIDFSNLKSIVRERTERLDHQHLNELLKATMANPTAENLAKFLFDDMLADIDGILTGDTGYRLFVGVEESPGCIVTYTDDIWRTSGALDNA